MPDSNYDNYRLGCEVYRAGTSGLEGFSMFPYYETFRNRIWAYERNIPEIYEKNSKLSDLMADFTQAEIGTIRTVLSNSVDVAAQRALNERTRKWRISRMHIRIPSNIGGRFLFRERAGR